MKTIVCYGDSNTYGYNPENGFRYEYEERWTTILQKELKDSAIVIPEGLNGRTTSFEDELRPGRNGATYLDMFTQPRTDRSGSVNAWNE